MKTSETRPQQLRRIRAELKAKAAELDRRHDTAGAANVRREIANLA